MQKHCKQTRRPSCRRGDLIYRSAPVHHPHRWQYSSDTGKPWFRAYWRHSRCPLSAARRTCQHPRGSRVRARTANTPGALPRSPSARVSIPGAAVLVRVLETLQVPVPRSISMWQHPRGSCARARTANTQVPVPRSTSARVSIPGAAVLCAYRKHSSCPCLAARAHVSASQGQLCSCAYRRHSRCSCSAARVHVSASQGQLCSCAYRRHSRCPPLAAKQQTTPFSTRHDSPDSFIARQHVPPRARRARARARRVWAVEVLEGRPAEETRRTDRVRGGHHRGEGGSPRSIRGGCGSFRRRRGASSSGARRSDKVARASRRRFSRTRQEGILTKERYETPHRDEEKHTDT